MIDQSFLISNNNPFFPLPPSLGLSFSRLALLWNPITQVSLLGLFLLTLIAFLFLKKQKKSLKFSLLTLFGIFLLWLLITGLIRFWLSQRHFFNAQRLAQTNLGQETVRELEKAVNFNPLNDTYHLSLAQTSLSLANQEAKKEGANQEKVEHLIQQAIEQGKIATLLNPKKTENWLGLGKIYLFLGGISGAKDWTLKCYQNAAELQSDNPQIHEMIAAVYYSQGKIAETKAELETALSLTEKDSSDFRRIKSELERLK